MQDHINDIEADAQANRAWTAPSLTRLDAGAAEFNVTPGPDGLFEAS